MIQHHKGANGQTIPFYILFCLLVLAGKPVSAQQPGMMVRIAEIEVRSGYLEEYRAILQEEAAASVKLEPGVFAIFPMAQKDDSTRIRILEIYAGKEAYEQHLKTPHFLKYKNSTLHMVKSLKLLDMNAIDPHSMPAIFKKLH